MHAVEKAEIRHSDVVVIAGLGAIGLSMANMASLSLPKLVIGIDVKENRLAMGKQFGADVVLNPMKCNVVEEIMKLTEYHWRWKRIEDHADPVEDRKENFQ